MRGDFRADKDTFLIADVWQVVAANCILDVTEQQWLCCGKYDY